MMYQVSGRVQHTVTGEDRKSQFVEVALEEFFVQAADVDAAVKTANRVVNTCGHQNEIHLVLKPVDVEVMA